MTSIGCLMGEDLARDRELELVVIGYTRTKFIPIIRETPALVTRVLDDAGLLDDYDLLSLMEREFYEFEKEKREADELKEVVHRRTREKAEQL